MAPGLSVGTTTGNPLRRVQRDGKAVRGEHAGFFDLFVPVYDATGMRGILATGPFARARPTSAEIQRRWYDLSGAQGRLTDPAFSRYVMATANTLTLEGPMFATFERLVGHFADLTSDRGNVAAILTEAEVLLKRLYPARAPERMWDSARSLVDERSGQWPEQSQPMLLEHGLRNVPRHVVVGLLSSRNADAEPLDDLLGRMALQRASTSLARKIGGVVCGRIGDHGLFFLIDEPGKGQRARVKLADLGHHASTLASRFGFRLHVGGGHAEQPGLLPQSYRAALWAAERALAEGAKSVDRERTQPSSEQLALLLKELGRGLEDGPDVLRPRFDRYIESVLANSVYQIERARVRLAVGLERLIEPLVTGELIDSKILREIRRSMQVDAEDARTVTELVATYRGLVSSIDTSVRKPTRARQERGTSFALHFMREHLAEELTLSAVARAAGFAPSHFARLLKREAGVSFSRYVQRLRIERAQQMLEGTGLRVEQIQKVCGFRAAPHFYRTFKRHAGVTPASYRKRHRGKRLYPWQVPAPRRRA